MKREFPVRAYSQAGACERGESGDLRTVHEMSITVSILETVRDQMVKSGVERLKSVKLRIGEMAAVEPDSLRFCFKACTDGSPWEGAVLEIETVPLTGRCSNGNNVFGLEHYFSSVCPHCGGTAADLVSGRELDIISMEVE